MRKRAIRLRHFVCVFAFLDRVPLPNRGILNLLRQRLGHCNSLAIIRVLHDPARREGNLSRRRHFHRHLISCSTYAARFYFQPWANIFNGFVYDFQRIDRIRTFARFFNRSINDPLRERFLAALHHSGDEPGHRRTPVAGIDVLFLFVNSPSSRHCRSSSNLFFLLLGSCRRRFCRAASTGSATFRSLRSVLGATTPASIDAERVKRTTHNVIANPRQIFHAPTAHEHDRVLLQIMPLARNVGNHFLPIRQPHFCHFTKRRVRLLRCARHHLHAHPAPLRTTDQRRRLRFHRPLSASFSNQLINRGHFQNLKTSAAKRSCSGR